MVNRAAIFAVQPYNCLRLHRERCLDRRPDAPAALALSDAALVRAAATSRAISVAGSTRRPSSRREAVLDPPDRLEPRSR